jgi:hypothetical protein
MILALASLVFVRALSPHEAAESRTGTQPPAAAAPRTTVLKSPAQPRIYYYVVASEEEAKRLRGERMNGADYYGAGYPATPPVVVVARTQEVFDSLQDVLAQTKTAGGPPYTVLDLR